MPYLFPHDPVHILFMGLFLLCECHGHVSLYLGQTFLKFLTRVVIFLQVEVLLFHQTWDLTFNTEMEQSKLNTIHIYKADSFLVKRDVCSSLSSLLPLNEIGLISGKIQQVRQHSIKQKFVLCFNGCSLYIKTNKDKSQNVDKNMFFFMEQSYLTIDLINESK